MKLMVRLVEEVSTPQMRGRPGKLPASWRWVNAWHLEETFIAWVMSDNEWL